MQGVIRRGLPVAGSYVAAVLLLWGALAKCIDPHAGVSFLASIGLRAPGSAACVVLGAGAEAGLGVILLCRPRDGRPRAAAAALLCVFTGTLIAALRLLEPPECACLGKWRMFDESWRNLLAGVCRNCIVAALCLLPLASPDERRQHDVHDP